MSIFVKKKKRMKNLFLSSQTIFFRSRLKVYINQMRTLNPTWKIGEPRSVNSMSI